MRLTHCWFNVNILSCGNGSGKILGIAAEQKAVSGPDLKEILRTFLFRAFIAVIERDQGTSPAERHSRYFVFDACTDIRIIDIKYSYRLVEL